MALCVKKLKPTWEIYSLAVLFTEVDFPTTLHEKNDNNDF